MGWGDFLLTYLLGGVTLFPLILVAILLHAHLTFPRHGTQAAPEASGDGLVQAGDDVGAIRLAQKEIKMRANSHDAEVTTGYFAVCREYTPMGINAKPIERSTPVGSATVAAPSPSVYQTMYRSIFDRKPASGPLDSKNNISQRPKRAGNVFYVVLRHGHLMLFDDEEQLEVRHVISLAHHDVSIYSGEEMTAEGELWIKRNAICLSRNTDGAELGPDMQAPRPFFLFSENCSAKEDFYFALLRNQQQNSAAGNTAPSPVQFDVKNIISLVQRIHSSEEYLQTRWLNAVIGRLFLGIHRTKDMEQLIRDKLTKKISRVNRPTFLSSIEIRAIDTGDSAPYISNPHLRDLTVEGECCIEAEVRYSGNFRLEVATAVRIDLGTRFKAREVDLVLAVVVRKLEGHVLFKIKAPPSNRLWFSFQQMPKMEMAIEPIVSSRQITYMVILRQIENRIKEVIAETVVLPFWDDMPFFNTESKKWRGGIFHDEDVATSSKAETVMAQEDTDLVEHPEDKQGKQGKQGKQEIVSPRVEKSQSMPVMENKSAAGLYARKVSNQSYMEVPPTAALSSSSSSTGIHVRTEARVEPKTESRPSWSGSFAQPPTPIVRTDATNADSFKPSACTPDNRAAITAMATLSARSQSVSPTAVLSTASCKPYMTSKSSSRSSSREATEREKGVQDARLPRTNTASSNESHEAPRPTSPTPSGRASVRSHVGTSTKTSLTRRESSGQSSQAEHLVPPPSVSLESHKRTALAAVTNVAASAKRWGLNALQRRAEAGVGKSGNQETESSVDLTQPMGRGQPLPPPGTPLPMPDKRFKTAPIPVPKRKPLPPPVVLDPNPEEPKRLAGQTERRQLLPPPFPSQRPPQETGSRLPKRKQQQLGQAGERDILVVAAPTDKSTPSTPLSESHDSSNAGPWAEDTFDHLLEVDERSRYRVDGMAPDSRPEPLPTAGAKERGEKEVRAVTEWAVDDDAYDAWLDEDARPDSAKTGVASGTEQDRTR